MYLTLRLFLKTQVYVNIANAMDGEKFLLKQSFSKVRFEHNHACKIFCCR